MKASKSYASGMSDYSSGGSGGGYQSGGAPDFNSQEFKSQKEDFFSRKQAENSMRRDDLPPSQVLLQLSLKFYCIPRKCSYCLMILSCLGHP